MSAQEPICVRATPEMTYRYAAGRYGSAFLAGMREGRLVGSRCTRCAVTLLPPRVACTQCFGEMDEVVDLPLTGRLLAFTQVTFPFLDPFTGVQRPIPYCYGMVQVDGTDNTFQYFLSEKDPSRLSIGQAVQAVFRSERRGEMADLLHFQPLEA